VIVAGSVGTAMALPTAKRFATPTITSSSLKARAAARWWSLKTKCAQASHEAYILTDDGSYGEQGLVTKKLNELSPPAASSILCLPLAPCP
jgi:ferredoxin/flavodoxin---NADP+ reductase